MYLINLHSPNRRQCYFDDERDLRYFKSYSQSNCQTECLANYTMARCGCVKFWMPSESSGLSLIVYKFVVIDIKSLLPLASRAFGCPYLRNRGYSLLYCRPR